MVILILFGCVNTGTEQICSIRYMGLFNFLRAPPFLLLIKYL
jgi:hypothetical protein